MNCPPVNFVQPPQTNETANLVKSCFVEAVFYYVVKVSSECMMYWSNPCVVWICAVVEADLIMIKLWVLERVSREA
ncbi:hypothetical protein GQ457_01G028300 [Hibiscus cannabinus]